MAQRNSGRIDRFAQMSKQEEIIAKKRQEILEKQRTAQLAKAVVAAQNLAAKLKEDEHAKNGGDTEVVSAVVSADSEAVEIDEKSAKPKKEELVEPTKSISSFAAKTGKITFGLKRNQPAAHVVEQPPVKVQNSFCNDGSFLENFKKILEKHSQQPTLVSALSKATNASETTTDAALTTSTLTDSSSTSPHGTTSPMQLPQGVPPPVSQITTASFAFNPSLMSQNLLLSQQNEAQEQQSAAATTLTTFATQLPVPPPPPQHGIPAAFFTTAATTTAASSALLMPDPLMSMHATDGQFARAPDRQCCQVAEVLRGTLGPCGPLSTVAPPPPPPPPQIPLALANLAPLYMIPAPEPLQLNAIPAPKDFDLNAIPKPQLNLEAIQMPLNEQQQLQLQAQAQAQQQEQQQQQQMQQEQNSHQDPQQVFSDNCLQLPTTVDNLIEMVSNNGEDYEDIIRSHKNELHPAMWFLFDKNSEQYHRYRQQLDEHRQRMEQMKWQGEQQQQQQFPQHAAITNSQQQTISSDAGTSATSATGAADYTNSILDEEKYDPESVISGDVDSDDEYMRGMMDRNRDNIKRRIECRNELSEEERQEREAEAEEEERRRQEKKKIRKSRWGEKVKLSDDTSSTSVPISFANQNKPLLSTVTRSDPALLQYARQNYGSTNLTEEEWNKCEEHYKVNLLYQDMMRKRQEIDRLARSGKFKYEYDSDEDVDGGTWEHKLRCAEMEATQAWAQALTKQSEGKHHIGDFLPPEELKKFMEQYEAKKNNRQPDLSDYKEYKLKEDNIGFKMLQKLGWKEGQGLGTDGAGIVDPVNKGPQREGNQGLGVTNVSTPENCDNEYDAYRKRMMLAYRFRPNPLNNPRRAYY